MTSTKKDWLIPAGLIVLSLVPAVAGTARLAQLAGGGSGAAVTEQNARFFASPIPVVIHIVAALTYSLLGAWQFSPSFRRNRRAWHRTVGKILIPAGLLVAMSGLWMAQFYPWPAGDGMAVYVERLIAGTAMLASIGRGIDAIGRRQFSEHGDWMIRAYAIGLGAGTQVFTHLPWFILVNAAPGETARGVMMGAGWATNIIVAEWIIRRTPQRHRIGLTGA